MYTRKFACSIFWGGFSNSVAQLSVPARLEDGRKEELRSRPLINVRTINYEDNAQTGFNRDGLRKTQLQSYRRWPCKIRGVKTENVYKARSIMENEYTNIHTHIHIYTQTHAHAHTGYINICITF